MGLGASLVLKLTGFAGLKLQMAFIKDVPALVPTLVKLNIIHYPVRFDWENGHEIRDRISKFFCAYANPEIVYK
ncbi:unnamed protein product [Cuscuta campestris]|uniref:Uncharacterized protein n=1 Tax=Cuscuta campestris TaxID=132261 RepID=A0A484M9C1_9ASTE|nr:unnamed protein product [Cuscuta campestris]